MIRDPTGNILLTNSTDTKVLFPFEGMTEEAAAAAEGSGDTAVWTMLLGVLLNILFGGLLQATWILMNNL